LWALNADGKGAGIFTSIVQSTYQIYQIAANVSLTRNFLKAEFLRPTLCTMATQQFNLINTVDGVSYGEQLK
jgi:hypothetical protein